MFCSTFVAIVIYLCKCIF